MGINELFKALGNKYLNVNSIEKNNNSDFIPQSKSMKLDKNIHKRKEKKKCCQQK